MTMLTSTLFKHLKSNHRLMLNEIDGRLWVSNSYWLVPVDASIEHLLSDYNLAPEPMVCEVHHTIKRMATSQVPDFATLLGNATEHAGEPVTRYQIAGMDVLVTNPSTVGILHELWITEDRRTRVMVNTDLRATLEALAGGVDQWRCADTDPAVRPLIAERDGEVVGLLMPVRPAESLAKVTLLGDEDDASAPKRSRKARAA